MGIETEGEHGGSECSFTSAIITIEGKDKSIHNHSCVMFTYLFV
jgi:hypothetical protein